MTRARWQFCITAIVEIFLAHALAYFLHEYSHAIVAWLLGWRPAPFAIDYGPLTLSNLLFQQDVGDGVDYAPIFAAGHGPQAALIAAAGPGIGNGVVYALLSWALRRTLPAQSFLFWLAVMSAGNIWSYVPIRTVTTHADIAWVAQGLGLTGWQALLVLAPIPLLVLWSLFARLLPHMRARLSGGDALRDAFIVLMTSYLCFGFSGSAGFSGHYGEVSADLSIFSMFVALPLVAVRCLASPSSKANAR